MFRYLCLMLILVLSLGNVIRLGRLEQTHIFFWLSLSLLLFALCFIVIETIKAVRMMQKPKRIRLSDLKKYEDLW
jgi:hypothetical protein